MEWRLDIDIAGPCAHIFFSSINYNLNIIFIIYKYKLVTVKEKKKKMIDVQISIHGNKPPCMVQFLIKIYIAYLYHVLRNALTFYSVRSAYKVSDGRKYGDHAKTHTLTTPIGVNMAGARACVRSHTNRLWFLRVQPFSEYFITNYVDASHTRCSYANWGTLITIIFYLNNESRTVIISLSTATSTRQPAEMSTNSTIGGHCVAKSLPPFGE